MKFLNKFKNRKGFTLVETLMALFIFSLSVVVVMAVLSQGISSTSFAKDKVVATYLAEEGIEYFRNMRDTSMYYTEDKNVAWANFVIKMKNSGCDSVNGCYFVNEIEFLSEMPIMNINMDVCGEECPVLLYDGDSYNYISGTQTSFSRKINFREFAADQAQISSEVSWKHKGVKHKVTFSHNLNAWIE